MDMESDLGIDSIKRVEILGAMQTRYPTCPNSSRKNLLNCVLSVRSLSISAENLARLLLRLWQLLQRLRLHLRLLQ